MAIRLSGLASGLDTESIIKEMMSAQSMKLTKIQNSKTKLEWKEEKWKSLNKKIYALYTDEISKLKLQSSYMTKSASISDSSKATVTAGSTVPAGSHTLEIKEIASAQYVTGAKLNKENLTSKSKLTEFGIAEGTKFDLTVNGKTESFVVAENSKMSDLTKFAKDNGVNLSYDANNQRFFMSSSESGTEHAFSLTSTAQDDKTSEYIATTKTITGYEFLTSTQQAEINSAIEKVKLNRGDDDYKNAVNTLNKYATAMSSVAPDGTIPEDKDAFKVTLHDKLTELSSSADPIPEDEKMKAVITNLSSSYGAADNKALLDIGLGEITESGCSNAEAKYVKASNCKVIFNDAEFENSSNNITINGLTINAIEKTDSPLKINVSNDAQSVYNVVKNFVKGYNTLLQEVNDLYYADSSKGYDVLTDEEREAMTEEQIEKWENKIKDSLLRRDNTLSSVKSALTTIADMSVEVNGKYYSLSSFGIGTTDYTEKGLLHINGDVDDSSTSDEADKLMAAINNDPDLVMQVFTQLGNQLYSNMQEKMGSTSLSSALTFYNDKQISSQKTDYEEQIKKWEEKLSAMENRYYAQFSAMETAMSKLNAQTSYITSMFSS